MIFYMQFPLESAISVTTAIHKFSSLFDAKHPEKLDRTVLDVSVRAFSG